MTCGYSIGLIGYIQELCDVLAKYVDFFRKIYVFLWILVLGYSFNIGKLIFSILKKGLQFTKNVYFFFGPSKFGTITLLKSG